MSTTNVTLVGNICSKLELKDIPANKGMSATQVCTFRVACDKKIPTGQTDEDNRPIYDSADVLYIGVECWGELAKNVNSTLNIGSPVVISGKIVTSSWEEKVEGDKTVRRSIIRCRAYHVGPDLLREAFISRGEMMDLAEETAQKRLKKTGGTAPATATSEANAARPATTSQSGACAGEPLQQRRVAEPRWVE